MNLWFVTMAIHHPVMTSLELGVPGSVIVHCNTVGRTATKHQSEFQNRICLIPWEVLGGEYHMQPHRPLGSTHEERELHFVQ